MTTSETVRRLALALPEAREVVRAGKRTFVVDEATFAALDGRGRLRIMFDAGAAHEFAAVHPDLCRAYSRSRIGALVVNLDQAREELVEDLIAESYHRKAPKELVRPPVGR
jgi:hypothetical protein